MVTETVSMSPFGRMKMDGEWVPSKEEVVQLFRGWDRQHSLHTHPYLDALFDEGMDDIEQVRRFVEVLYTFCVRFHDCLFALGLNAEDERVRRAIVDNLTDEFGGGDPKVAHLALMRKLLYSLGYTDESISQIQVNPAAQAFMDEILRLCKDDHPLKAIGCICIGAECNGAEYFRQIYSAFQKKSCTKDADLYILKIHAGDDVEHRIRMLDLIQPYLDDPEARRLIMEGYLASVLLFDQLWTSMAFYHNLPRVSGYYYELPQLAN